MSSRLRSSMDRSKSTASPEWRLARPVFQTHPVRQHLLVLVAAFAQNVQEQNRSLPEVAHILIEGARWNRPLPDARIVIDCSRRQLVYPARQFIEHSGWPEDLERTRTTNGFGHRILLLSSEIPPGRFVSRPKHEGCVHLVFL